MRIQAGRCYTYKPTPYDKAFVSGIKDGDVVSVIKPPGMPRAGTINAGHVHVMDVFNDVHFIYANSLAPYKKGQ